MTIGGWSSLDALTPYLTRPTDEQIQEEMVAAGWDRPPPSDADSRV